MPPMAETRALYDAIISDTLTAGRPAPASRFDVPALQRPGVQRPSPAGEALPFIGRAAELATLRHLAGSPRLGLVDGAAGVGRARRVEG